MLIFDENTAKNEYDSCEKKTYLKDLQKIILESKTPLEGNSFYFHNSLQVYYELYSKQVNLFWCGKQATKICEIGFNAGHSVLLMLLGRDKTPIDFTIFDIGQHAYTRPCLEYMKSKFEHVNFEYIEGDSTVVMPTWIANNTCVGLYDLVHVDGGHSEHCILNDMKNADVLVKGGGIVIVDDTNSAHINKCVDDYISTGNYREINLLKTSGYPHRVIQKIATV